MKKVKDYRLPDLSVKKIFAKVFMKKKTMEVKPVEIIRLKITLPGNVDVVKICFPGGAEKRLF